MFQSQIVLSRIPAVGFHFLPWLSFSVLASIFGFGPHLRWPLRAILNDPRVVLAIHGRTGWQSSPMEIEPDGDRTGWRSSPMEIEPDGDRARWRSSPMEIEPDGDRARWRSSRMPIDRNGNRARWQMSEDSLLRF